MSFLGSLADQINSQFSIGENTDQTLSAVVNGQNLKYGSLGDFAQQVDQSAERRYVEEGYLRRDPYNTDPKQFEVLMQEPSITILVKKKMFSSINENYRPDFMDADEKIYYKTMKVLFQNKCRQIAALEKLSKIQQITTTVGNISDQLIPIIISLTDQANSGFTAGSSDLFGQVNSNGDISNFTKAVDRIRRLYAFNTSNQTTTWLTDPTNLFQSQFGEGTGVIELTNVTSFSSSVGLDLRNPGSFSFSVSDPYESMLITEYDIERALSDATNAFYNNKIYQFGQDSAQQLINDTQTRLNQLRKNRGASPITFQTSPNTLIGRRVIAIFDRLGIELPFVYDAGFGGLGSSVTVADPYLKGGAVAGLDGLDTSPQNSLGPDSNIMAASPESELSVFQRLITAIFNKLQLEANSQGAFQTTNKKLNYPRRKLRANFSGKLIVQPMDTVHIYVNSKSRYDTKLLSGLQNMFSGAGILQNLNNTLTDFKNAADTLFNPSGSVNLQVEKAAYVGSDFPNFLWALLRGQFVTEKEGTHIFAGLVQNANDNWSDGKFVVDVRGTDNTAYFDMGQINFKPGADTFNGSLFDPLTPFKTKFDTISSNAKSDTPELLDENKALLGTSQDTDSPLVKFKLGPNSGQPAHADNLVQDTSIDKSSGLINKVFYSPDGLVYKWKEGIGTLVQFGNSIDLNDPNKVGTPALTKEPFAGQDVMNVLSLLVTGQPYNFANYWKAVANFDGFQRDPQSQQDSAYSYYSALKTDLTKNNIIWGNFVPFKNLSMDEQSFAKAMQSQFNAVSRNKDLDAKLQELMTAKAQANIFSSAAVLNVPQTSVYNNAYSKAQAKVTQLSSQITSIIAAIQKDNQSTTSGVTAGNDVSFDSSQFNASPGTDLSDPSFRRLLRRQINYLTRRLSYNVRANADKNLFVVDDYYDKDYDIVAYEQSLADGVKLYNNEFNSIRDKIIQTADLLNLEVFADTQGHIRVRPPQYNRMPSSIFYRMLYLKSATGVQVFPQFLSDLFSDQIDTLIQRTEILEDQIRLDCAALGIDSDSECISFILSNGSTSGSGDTFSFLSNEDGGTITDLVSSMSAANPDQRDAINTSSRTFTTLQNQATSTKSVFTAAQRARAVLDAVTKNKLNISGFGVQAIPNYSTNPRIDTLIQRIQTKSGQQVPRDNFLVSNSLLGNGVVITGSQSVDAFKVTQDLADKIRDRQKVLKLLYNSVKNATEAKSLDNDNSVGNNLLTPGNFGNSNTPEIFEHMIEDETYDDYGLGSGSRYIIKRAQIRNISIAETPPDFTMVEVRGVLNIFAPNALPEGLNSFPSGGNGLVTAAAVDYDSWRNYGFRQQAPISVPFLSDPNTQCAPYASMILSRARRNILRGTITISGNEYQQPGEVVFLQDRGLLFYVNSVRHNFTYATGFTTTLDLTYGHSPGEYIPTTLDVIGKLIYNNRDISNYVVQRQSSSNNDSNMGVALRDDTTSTPLPTGTTNDSSATVALNDFNSKTISNILYTAAYMINANNSKGNTIRAQVQLRIYHDKNNQIDTNLQKFAEMVKTALTSDNTGPKQPTGNTTGIPSNPHLNSSDVVIVPINMDDATETRSPSQKALDAARNKQGSTSSSGGGASPPTNSAATATTAAANSLPTVSGGGGVPTSNGTMPSTTGAVPAASTAKDTIRVNLFKYVVDCWLSFEQVSSQNTNTNNAAAPATTAAANSVPTVASVNNGAEGAGSAVSTSNLGPGF